MSDFTLFVLSYLSDRLSFLSDKGSFLGDRLSFLSDRLSFLSDTKIFILGCHSTPIRALTYDRDDVQLNELDIWNQREKLHKKTSKRHSKGEKKIFGHSQ